MSKKGGGQAPLQFGTSESNGVRKGALDHCVYKGLVLPNNMQVLLISDKLAQFSTAALSVKVGFLSDPADYPGLANLCRQVLLLGNSKYPDPSMFKSFLSVNEGAVTGETKLEECLTTMHVRHEAISTALDYFGHCFIDPTFEQATIINKRNSLEAQYRHLKDEFSWHAFLLMARLANSNNPLHKFGQKNARFSTREVNAGMLSRFFKTFYSANTMKLVIRSIAKVEELEQVVRSVFSQVRNLKIPKSPYLLSATTFSSKELGKQINLNIEGQREILINWVIQLKDSNNLQVACNNVSELLQSQAGGSLIWFLTGRGWATGVSSGVSLRGHDFLMFSVRVRCTYSGISNHYNEILNAVYAYIALIRSAGVLDWFIKETSILYELSFLYPTRDFSLTQDGFLASQMHRLPTEQVLINTYMNHNFTAADLNYVTSALVPENSVIISSNGQSMPKKSKEENDLLGSAFKFNIASLKSSLAKELKNANPKTMGLLLPKRNLFLAEDFKIRPFEKPTVAEVKGKAPSFLSVVASKKTALLFQGPYEKGKTTAAQIRAKDVTTPWPGRFDTLRPPVLIEAHSRHTLWFKQDVVYSQPKLATSILISSPKFGESPVSHMVGEVYAHVFRSIFAKQASHATAAGIEFTSKFNSDGLEIGVFGFHDKLEDQFKLVLSSLKDISKVDEHDFQEAFMNIQTRYAKMPARSTLTWNIFESRYMLQDSGWRVDDRLKAMSTVSFLDVLEHGPLMFEDTTVEILVHGNAIPRQAQSFAKDAVKILLSAGQRVKKGSKKATFMRKRTLQLEPRTEYYYFIPNSEGNPKSSAVLSFQLSSNNPKEYSKHFAFLVVFWRWMSPKFRNFMKRKDKPDDVYRAQPYELNGVLFYELLLESRTIASVQLVDQTFNFLRQMEGAISSINTQELENAKSEGLRILLEQDSDLYEEASRWWNCIKSGKYDFSNNLEVAQNVLNLTTKDFVNYCKQFFLPDSPSRAVLVSGILSREYCRSASLKIQASRDAGSQPFGAEMQKVLKPQTNARVVHVQSAADFRTKSKKFPSTLEQLERGGKR